jgi:hypothetical protein
MMSVRLLIDVHHLLGVSYVSLDGMSVTWCTIVSEKTYCLFSSRVDRGASVSVE